MLSCPSEAGAGHVTSLANKRYRMGCTEALPGLALGL